MPDYVRLYVPGATYFFTVVTHKRRPILTTPMGRTCLRRAWNEVAARFPFRTDAVCLLPDHLHCLWTLPDDDSDFSTRWRRVKTLFTQKYLRMGGGQGSRSGSQRRRHEAGVWQPRFWEHCVRSDEDFARHFDYIHYNAVKHGLVEWPEQWPWSTFHRYARKGWYDTGWGHEEPASIVGCVPMVGE